jgi:hypothetical protein
MTDRGVIAATIRDAVLAIPGVARLTPGTAVEVATLFAGGKVCGIRLGDPVEVHVAVLDRTPIPALAEEIRGAVKRILGSVGEHPRCIDVVVDDIEPAVVHAGERSAGAGRPVPVGNPGR